MKNVLNKFVMFFKISLFVIFPVFLISCLYRKPQDTVISNKKITLTTTPLVIQCQKPLFQNRKNAGLVFNLSKKWTLARPTKKTEKAGIQLEDGNVVYLDVILIDDNNKNHTTNAYGIGGGFVAHFSIPKSIKIVKVQIVSSAEIECDKIYWHCYDPV